MFPMLLALAIPSSGLITFLIVAVIAAVLLAYLPTILTLDAKVWNLIRLVVIIALLVYALSLFGLI